MAKKTVASLQSGASKNYTKVVKMVRGKNNNSYTFTEGVVTKDMVNDFFTKK